MEDRNDTDNNSQDYDAIDGFNELFSGDEEEDASSEILPPVNDSVNGFSSSFDPISPIKEIENVDIDIKDEPEQDMEIIDTNPYEASSEASYQKTQILPNNISHRSPTLRDHIILTTGFDSNENNTLKYFFTKNKIQFLDTLSYKKHISLIKTNKILIFTKDEKFTPNFKSLLAIIKGVMPLSIDYLLDKMGKLPLGDLKEKLSKLKRTNLTDEDLTFENAQKYIISPKEFKQLKTTEQPFHVISTPSVFSNIAFLILYSKNIEYYKRIEFLVELGNGTVYNKVEDLILKKESFGEIKVLNFYVKKMVKKKLNEEIKRKFDEIGIKNYEFIEKEQFVNKILCSFN
eukprot:GAHX01000823.1.p1 GENE.GAHX01000823.1~~GAHX01000823.1.p1  ORF type:complete len:357 (+),score=95.85 GAHX01000823.1:38-1072(+)